MKRFGPIAAVRFVSPARSRSEPELLSGGGPGSRGVGAPRLTKGPTHSKARCEERAYKAGTQNAPEPMQSRPSELRSSLSRAREHLYARAAQPRPPAAHILQGALTSPISTGFQSNRAEKPQNIRPKGQHILIEPISRFSQGPSAFTIPARNKHPANLPFAPYFPLNIKMKR